MSDESPSQAPQTASWWKTNQGAGAVMTFLFALLLLYVIFFTDAFRPLRDGFLLGLFPMMTAAMCVAFAALMLVDRLRKKGVRDFRRYFREHPRVLRQMVEAIKDIDVNQALLDTRRAPDKETFLQAERNPARIEAWMRFHEEELAALAAGARRVVLEETEKALDGSDVVIRSRTSPG